MTTQIDKQQLQSYLEERIAELDTTDNIHGGQKAVELAGLLRAVNRGDFDVKDSEIRLIGQRDPLETVADRLLAGNLVETMRSLAVGDVVSVQDILQRRADEAERFGKELHETRARVVETLQELLTRDRIENADQSDEAAFRADSLGGWQITEPKNFERLYNETGLRDRNGDR